MVISAGPAQAAALVPVPVPAPADLADAFERSYVGQFTTPTLGLLIHIGGLLADPDGATANVSLNDINGRVIFTRVTDRVLSGSYTITLGSTDTAVVGNYSLTWDYAVAGVSQSYTTFIEIGPSAPAYDALDLDMQGLIENIYVRFADAFDSPNGGPNLYTYFQAHWGRGRIAQLLEIALGKLNVLAQPSMTFGLWDPGKFPMAAWGQVLEQATYIEVLRHLIRSYVEQPDPQGIVVSRLDRRDYMNRWEEILKMEMDDYISMRDVFKISYMGLGRPRVLVSGGVFGNYSPTRIAGSAAARPRMWARWYVILLLASTSLGVHAWSDHGLSISPNTSGNASISRVAQTPAGRNRITTLERF